MIIVSSEHADKIRCLGFHALLNTQKTDKAEARVLRFYTPVGIVRRFAARTMVGARMVSPLLMLLGGASAFAPPGAAHALLRTSAAPKLSSIVMEDRVFELKLKLGDVRTCTACAWHVHGTRVSRACTCIRVRDTHTHTRARARRARGIACAWRLSYPHLACRPARPTCASRRESRRANRSWCAALRLCPEAAALCTR